MGELVQLEPGSFVNEWKIEKKLGEGAFGAVYICAKGSKKYALKVEGVNEKVQLLKMEVLVLGELKKANATRHFCTIEDKGRHDNFIYLVMNLLGKSLQDLRSESAGHKFSIGTACSIGIQCLEALEDLHSVGYLHRDVKPGNFTIGRKDVGELRKVYMLDFGMCRKFIHDNGTIKKPRNAAGFRGTLKYAPLSCHILREQCRKDDVESWLYMVVELTSGKLPWRNLTETNAVGVYKKRCRADKGIKRLFGGCPRRFVDILRLCDKTRFFDEPDYKAIRDNLKQSITDTHSEEYPYDWELDTFGEEGKNPEDPKVEKENRQPCDEFLVSKASVFTPASAFLPATPQK